MKKRNLAGLILGGMIVLGGITMSACDLFSSKSKSAIVPEPIPQEEFFSVKAVSKLDEDGVEDYDLSGEGQYKIGDQITLIAEDVEGYNFAYWQFDGEEVTEEKGYQLQDKQCNFTLTEEKIGTYTAVYNEIEDLMLAEELEEIGAHVTYDDSSKTATIDYFQYNYDIITEIDLHKHILKDEKTYTLTEIGLCEDIGCVMNYVDKINIPKSVTNIETLFNENNIETIKFLEEINVNNRNKNYTSVDGVLYNKDMTELILCPPKKFNADFVLPESVLTIRSDAFLGSEYYQTLVQEILDSKKGYGPLYIGHVLYKWIGDNFDNGSVEVREGTKGIADKAFYNKQELEDIILPDGFIAIGSQAFVGTKLNNLTIPQSLRYIGDGAFAYNTGYGRPIFKMYLENDFNENFVFESKTIVFEDKETEITSAIYNADKTELIFVNPLDADFEIANTTKEIRPFVFNYFQKESLVIPASVEKVGGYQFIGANTKEIIFNKNCKIKTIEPRTFVQMYNLDKLTIPASVEVIRCGAINSYKMNELVFEKGSKLREIGVLGINCPDVDLIIIPSNVRLIKEEAFNGCDFSAVLIHSAYIYNNLINSESFGRLFENVSVIGVLASIVDDDNNINAYLNSDAFTKSDKVEHEGEEYYAYGKN